MLSPLRIISPNQRIQNEHKIENVKNTQNLIFTGQLEKNKIESNTMKRITSAKDFEPNVNKKFNGTL